MRRNNEVGVQQQRPTQAGAGSTDAQWRFNSATASLACVEGSAHPASEAEVDVCRLAPSCTWEGLVSAPTQ